MAEKEIRFAFAYPSQISNLTMLGVIPSNPRRKKVVRAKRLKCPECGNNLVWIGDPDFSNMFRCLNKECDSFYTRYYQRVGKKLKPLPISLAEELMRRRK